MAHVIEVPEKSMDATMRCDRCGAQAYVEVALKSGTLLFCAHHMREHEGKMPEYAMIADHRPHLQAQEAGPRDAASAAQ